MNKHTVTQWRDLGEDLGQREVEIVAILGEFPYVAVFDALVDGERIPLIKMLRKDVEAMILEEIEIESRITADDVADFRRAA